MIKLIVVIYIVISPNTDVFRLSVFELSSLQIGTFRKIVPCHPKLITRALMPASPSINLIYKPKFVAINRKKSITS